MRLLAPIIVFENFELVMVQPGATRVLTKVQPSTIEGGVLSGLQLSGGEKQSLHE
jgi:hypothetical protein